MEQFERLDPHSVFLEERSKLSLTGVTEVAGFDEDSIYLTTQRGEMTVKGEGLHITKLQLETGEVTAEGKIDSLVYTSEKKKTGFFGRIFG